MCRGRVSRWAVIVAGGRRAAHFDHFKRRLDLCQSFGIGTLILAADFARDIEPQSFGRAVASLAQAGQWAAAFGVRLALEFRGTIGSATISIRPSAWSSSVASRTSASASICFITTRGRASRRTWGRLTPANLFHVQVCDVAGVPRELMTDSDRVMPGDGDFQLEPVIRQLRAIRLFRGRVARTDEPEFCATAASKSSESASRR